MSCSQSRLVDRHFNGRQSQVDEQSLRAHLFDCARCRERYRRQLLLASLKPGAPSAKERLGRALGVERPRLPKLRTWLSLVPAIGVAALLLVIFLPRRAQLVPRGGAVAIQPELSVYVIRPRAQPARVEGRIAPDDELAFAYRNPTAKKYLMVFATDGRGRVHWYYPAWTDPVADPVAISIASGASGASGDRSQPLPEAIAHDLEPGSLRLRAIFSDEPLHVREIEALAKRHGDGELPLDGAVQLVVPLEVRR